MKRIAALLAGFALAFAASGAEDHRAWQHGIDLVRVGARMLVIWGSPGNPPKPNPGGDWQHDIYYAWVADGSKDLDPRVLVSRPEAQEPPSAAINSNGMILVTSEDGHDSINQLAGLWDSALKPVRAFPFTIRTGGHSGHVASMGRRFLVAYSEGWVEGGGFLERGTGKDVYARIVEDDGRLLPEVKLTGSDPAHRDGWPLVAGSDRNWLVVWQRYPEMSLQAALIDGKGAVAARRTLMGEMPVRYAYDVAFAPQLGAFVVAGSSGDSGFVSLVGLDGKVMASRQGLPPMTSESRIVLGWDGKRLTGVYPVRPRGVAVVRLSATAIEPVRTIEHPYEWDYTGTTGAFVTPGRVLFLTLSRAGIRQVLVEVGDP